jgi:hypothetical protein
MIMSKPLGVPVTGRGNEDSSSGGIGPFLAGGTEEEEGTHERTSWSMIACSGS